LKGEPPALLLISVVTAMQVGCDSPDVGISVWASGGCSSGQKCTLSGGGTITLSQFVKAEFSSGTSSNAIAAYDVVWNVPTSDLTLNTQSPVQATLKATTDTNYQSSIVVTLSPVASTTSPVAQGYSVYTFGMENSTELTNWISQVSANINSNVNLSFTGNALFNQLGNAGVYTIYVSVSSSQAGVTPMGSATYSDPGTPPPTRCTTPSCPDQP